MFQGADKVSRAERVAGHKFEGPGHRFDVPGRRLEGAELTPQNTD